jgi:hypothetical protein
MCIGCLKKILISIEEYSNTINAYLAETTCECCRSFPSFCLGVTTDIQVLCLTKIKKQEQVCPNGILAINNLENILKNKIKEKLKFILGELDDVKETLDDRSYLIKNKQIKDLYDYLELLDEAEHLYL